MASTYCPDCDGKISITAGGKVGQRLICPHCDAELEVISLEPLELDWAYDWSWDEEEGDDEEEEEEDEDEDW
jgi:lysine biosynthesis protein LysW